jgi:hypothetical protein
MSYPGPGPIYKRCPVCGRSFRAFASELRKPNRAKFCTRACYSASRRAYSAALCDGRLEKILALPICQEVLDGDAATRRKR